MNYKEEYDISYQLYGNYHISGINFQVDDIEYITSFIKENKNRLLYPSYRFIYVRSNYKIEELKKIASLYNKKIIVCDFFMIKWSFFHLIERVYYIRNVSMRFFKK